MHALNAKEIKLSNKNVHKAIPVYKMQFIT